MNTTTEAPARQRSGDGPSQPAVISARSLSKVFDSGDGIRNIDVDVEGGTIVGFIGPSGSGKTTAVRMMTGLLEPSDGTIEVLGERPTDFDPSTRLRLGYMPQESVLYPSLSVRANLKFIATLYDRSRATGERLADALGFVELAGHEKKRVTDISGGMKRRLSLAATLVHDPDLIFLDEPTAGIDPILRRKFWDHFTDLKDGGKTLVVTTQYVAEAAYCDYVAVLADGELLMVDTPSGLRRAAYGGDVVVVDLAEPPTQTLIDEIRAVSSCIELEQSARRQLRLVVDDAAASLAKLRHWLADRDVGFERAEQWMDQFDDVFVALVHRLRTSPADDHADGSRE